MSTDIVQPVESLGRQGVKRIFVVLFYFGLETFVLFTAAGRIDWPAAWFYVGLRLFTFLTIGLWVARKNPAVVIARGQKSEKTQPWDIVFGRVYAPLLLIAPIVAGLDARWGWSAPLLWAQLGGFLMLIPAMILPYWAMAVNPFLVTTARMQEERGQYVVSSGPYRFVRHPMYSGAVLGALGTPLLLGSWWMGIPTSLAALALIMRTALEDRMLQANLPGYQEFATRTRYRLLPWVW